MAYETQGFNVDNSGKRVVVDPVCRIEGHMRVEVNLDSNNVIRNAVSTGTMWRGLEVILKGRDPRDAWAFTERICGVCTGTHALTSVRAVEDALAIKIPENANTIRNIMQLNLYVHDHLVHFYHLHALDWVDVVSALKADPKATSTLAQSISSWPLSSPGYFRDIQNRLKKFVESGQLGPFMNGYWGNPAYKLPPEANLMAVAHYLDALAWQRDVARLHAIFGGKNPHPHLVVGGAPNPIDLESDSAINAKRLSQMQDIILRMREFVAEVYVPDTLAIAGYYKDWATQGDGLGNFLCFGDFPQRSIFETAGFMVPRGVILNRDLSHIEEVDLHDPAQIEEFVSHAYYDYDGGKDRGLHPFEGQTTLNYTGPPPPYSQLDVARGYSWMKSPRWRGKAMEVGPLARMLMLVATGHDQAKELVEQALTTLQLPLAGLYSTLGRTAARTLETRIFVDAMQGWYDQLLANIKAGDTQTFDDRYWDPATWPEQARGAGFM